MSLIQPTFHGQFFIHCPSKFFLESTSTFVLYSTCMNIVINALTVSLFLELIKLRLSSIFDTFLAHFRSFNISTKNINYCIIKPKGFHIDNHTAIRQKQYLLICSLMLKKIDEKNSYPKWLTFTTFKETKKSSFFNFPCIVVNT